MLNLSGREPWEEMQLEGSEKGSIRQDREDKWARWFEWLGQRRSVARGSTDTWFVVKETYGDVVEKVEQRYGLHSVLLLLFYTYTGYVFYSIVLLVL